MIELADPGASPAPPDFPTINPNYENFDYSCSGKSCAWQAHHDPLWDQCAVYFGYLNQVEGCGKMKPPPPFTDRLKTLMTELDEAGDKILMRRVYIDICQGDKPAALILSQIIYWHQPAKNGTPRLKVKKDGK